jgi:hypothetical protein
MNVNSPKNTKWNVFMESPLALFAGVFSLLEGVMLIYFVGIKEKLDAIDGANVVLMTVALFALVVISRPEALYPPERWRELPRTDNARLAIIVVALFILILGGAFAVNINSEIFIKAYGG